MAAEPASQRSWSLPAASLEESLNRFAQQAGLTLAADPALTAGRSAPAVSGSHTVRQVLDRLLAGTGLEAVVGAESVSIRRAPVGSAAASLAEVTVRGRVERADGLPASYAGGQVARGGRVGMLGNVDVMDTPFNITSYTSQLIADQQASTVLDVLENEPSVRRSSPAGGAQQYYTIRGFDVGTSEIFFDGLPGLAPRYSSLPMDFTERLDVLKGPNALLYGMSPTGLVGGAVNLVPKRAGDKPLMRLAFGVESDAQWKGHLDLGRRFGPNGEWGLRFNGSYTEGDGYIDDQKKEGDVGSLALDYRGERLRVALDAVQALDGHRLRMTFIDGRVATVDFTPFFAESPGLAPLRDPAAFAKACLAEDAGWTVEWPELDIQIGADTLWLDAQAQNAPDENTGVFAQWRARNGLTLAEAADALGMTTRTMSAYSTGERPVPRYIALAVKGWEAEHAHG